MKFLLCGSLKNDWDYRLSTRGSKNQKILRYITFYLWHRQSEDWRMLGRSLLHQGLVEQTSDGYAVLKLNALSWK